MTDRAWSTEKIEAWKLIETKLYEMNKVNERLLGVGSGEIPVYKDGMPPNELEQKVRTKCARLRTDMFRESVGLVDLMRIFFTIAE